ncbi:MAG: GNAT family N-acetyltransferase [Planctomycetes bacterium]|nr:GNAT family N-acetyltransferase [Planctomycetota bacterium]
MEVRKLRPDDDRTPFRSGNLDLDRFFHRFAGQNQFRHHVGTTYVAVEEGVVVGFATVSPSAIEVKDLPPKRRKGLPSYPLPVLRLARLAVDERAQGRGVGLLLLKAVFVLARALATDFGCVGVVVDAKPEAVAFYARYGFEEFAILAGELGDRPAPKTLFLELGAIPATPEPPPPP